MALEQGVRGMGARRSGLDSNKWGQWWPAVVVWGTNGGALPQSNRYSTRVVASTKMLPKTREAATWAEASPRWRSRNLWRRSGTVEIGLAVMTRQTQQLKVLLTVRSTPLQRDLVIEFHLAQAPSEQIPATLTTIPGTPDQLNLELVRNLHRGSFMNRLNLHGSRMREPPGRRSEATPQPKATKPPP